METGDTSWSGELTIELLKHKSREFDIESIHTISLSRLDLNNISVIVGCVGLERLDLSYNDISKLHSLAALVNLTYLNVSANRLTTLDGLQPLDNLEKLDVAGNLIGGTEGLKALLSLPKLTNFRMHDSVKDISNPICMRQTYKQEVTSLLPGLLCLDGEILKGPGSELFHLFHELTASIGNERDVDRPIKTAPLPPQLAVDFLTELQPMECILQCNAEDLLNAQLSDCSHLRKRGEQLITEAEEKLRKQEKV